VSVMTECMVNHILVRNRDNGFHSSTRFTPPRAQVITKNGASFIDIATRGHRIITVRNDNRKGSKTLRTNHTNHDMSEGYGLSRS